MDFELNATQQRWVSIAQALAPAFRERARKYDESGEFPEENFHDLRTCGILKLGIPAEFGGAELGNCGPRLIQDLVIEKISQGCSSTGWNLMIHWVNTQCLNNLGSEKLRRDVLSDIVERGVLIGSLGSEVNTQDARAGKNVPEQLKIDSAFRPVAGGFLANGKKHFCTVAPAAEYLNLWVLAPGTSSNEEGLTLAIIPRDTPGIIFDRTGWDDCIGLRATASWSVTLKEVFVPWENVLGNPGDFVQKDPYTFDLGHIAHLLGTAQGIFDQVVQTLREREYLMKDEVYVYWTTEMHGALQAARASFWYTSWLWEKGRFDECLLATYNCLHTARQTALMIADRAFDVCGSRAAFRFLPIERAARDIRVASLHTRDTQLARLQARGILAGGKMFSKQKYGNKLAKPKTWSDLGIMREAALA
ncbi:MAG: acyl-CoA dehydrogenase family protein [Acetobacteraceae bacterium]